MKFSSCAKQVLGLACMLQFAGVGYLLGSAIFGTESDTMQGYGAHHTRREATFEVYGGARSISMNFADGRKGNLGPLPVVRYGDASLRSAPEASADVLETGAFVPMRLGHFGRAPSLTSTLLFPTPSAMSNDTAVPSAPGGGMSKEHGDNVDTLAKQQIALGVLGHNERSNPNSQALDIQAPHALGAQRDAKLKNLPGVKPMQTSAHLLTRDDTMLLKIQWPMHLGFNNIRFQLEVAIYLAVLLKRKLLAPARLRMRDCLDPIQCESSRCTQGMDNSWWCPTELFLDADMLKNEGGVVLVQPDDDSIERGRNRVVVDDAFDQTYAENAVWVERLPYQMRRLIGPDHAHPVNSTFQLHYQVCFKLSLCDRVSYVHRVVSLYSAGARVIRVLF
jgi:hypothetical protein